MKIIDAHTHVFPRYVDLAVKVMDRCEVEWAVTLEWHDGFGETLREHLKVFGRLYYDLSARIPILGLPGPHAERSRAFLIAYQDRVLFGTDAIYDPTNVPTGMQAQCLYQPGEIPLGDADPQERYVETTVAFLHSHLDFLTTSRVQINPPFKRNREGYSIVGLGLPDKVWEKILYYNARRIIPH